MSIDDASTRTARAQLVLADLGVPIASRPVIEFVVSLLAAVDRDDGRLEEPGAIVDRVLLSRPGWAVELARDDLAMTNGVAVEEDQAHGAIREVASEIVRKHRSREYPLVPLKRPPSVDPAERARRQLEMAAKGAASLLWTERADAVVRLAHLGYGRDDLLEELAADTRPEVAGMARREIERRRGD